ncbi:MAG: glutathione S-transferase family protein [Prochloraceae cyanobacterium]
MLKLYGATSVSRAGIVEWYLKEIGVDREFVGLDMMETKEHRNPEFLAINPMGKVPTIVDGDLTLWESGAILLYLAEKHGKMPEAIEQRAKIYQWLIFSNSTLVQGLFIEANREKESPKLLSGLNQVLQDRSYLLGEEFSVADVAVGSILGFAIGMLKMDFNDYPAVLKYIQKITERSAYKESIGKVPA